MSKSPEYLNGVADALALMDLAKSVGATVSFPNQNKMLGAVDEQPAATLAASEPKLEPKPKPAPTTARGWALDWQARAVEYAQNMQAGKSVIVARLFKPITGVDFSNASRGDLQMLAHFLQKRCGLEWSKRSVNSRNMAVYRKPTISVNGSGAASGVSLNS